MERATPVQMRKSLELSMSLRDAGIRFVPLPVMSEVDHTRLIGILNTRLEKIAVQAETDENKRR